MKILQAGAQGAKGRGDLRQYQRSTTGIHSQYPFALGRFTSSNFILQNLPKRVLTKTTGKGMSGTRADFRLSKDRGFQPLRFAFEAWTTHLSARNLFRDFLDLATPTTVCRRILRPPVLENSLRISPRGPVRTPRLCRHA